MYDGPSQNPNEKRPELGFFGGHKEPVRGRKWDHARESEPVIMQSNGQLSPVINSPWRDFIKASTYGSPKVEDQTVNPEFERILQVQTPGYDRPWCGDLDGADDPEKLAGLFYNKRQRKTFIQRWQVWSSSLSFALARTLTRLEYSSNAPFGAVNLPDDRAHYIYNCPKPIRIYPQALRHLFLLSKCIYHNGHCCGYRRYSLHSLDHLG